MALQLFITGTDTGIGKTYIASGLLRAFHQQQNFSTLGIKPVASGAALLSGELVNEDALALQENSSIKLAYSMINPLVFALPIAPHLAARHQNKALSVDILWTECQPAFNYPADVLVVEGCGGWKVPLNDKETMADFVQRAKLKVVMVVGIRLGCINHALITEAAILKTGVALSGWIGNYIEPGMNFMQENINTLKQWLSIPCLGVVDHQQDPAEIISTAKILSQS